MPNYKQAPKLYHNKTNFNSNNYYNLPQELMDRVFNQLDGKCGNQIKLITVLLGTLGNGSFGVSEKWICERTGMVQQTYSKARQALAERGWIYVEDGNLYVLPEIIRYGINYPDGATEEERKAIKIATISNCVNRLKNDASNNTKTQCDIVKQTQYDIVKKGQYDIVYNKINNINNNNINNQSVGVSVPYTQIEEKTITRDFANNIEGKQWITDNLIFTTTGKYVRIKEE